MKPSKLLTVALFLLLANPASAQSKIFVKAGASGAHTGSSWATAFDDLTTALNAATPGDSIFVTTGTYKPTLIAGTSTDPRDETFLLKDKVSVFGGFTGTETTLADRPVDYATNPSVLSGNIGAPDSLDNCYHVITALNISDKTTLNGFTVTEGNANGTGSNLVGSVPVPRNYGGGLYNANSNYTIQMLSVTNNVAVAGGAGITNSHSPLSMYGTVVDSNVLNGIDPAAGGGAGMLNSHSNCTLKNVSFGFNKAYGTQGGGGMRNENSIILYNIGAFYRNYVEDGDGGAGVYNTPGSDGQFLRVYFMGNNTTEQGGGMYNDNSSPTLTTAYFSGNIAKKGGGAIENDGGSNAILNDVRFYNNSTPGNGGAIQNWKSSPVINNVYFEENIAGVDGGAIYNYNDCNPLLTNCSLIYNEAGNNGGAFFNKRSSNPVMTNTLIIRNTAGKDGGGVYNSANDPTGSEFASPIFTNVTIANNTAGRNGGGCFDDGFGALRLRNSIVHGNKAPSNKDIASPPASVATALYHSIAGDQYFETGTIIPASFTSGVFLDTMFNNDFRLAKFSPAIDRGDSALYAPGKLPDLTAVTTDLRGADRIMGANIDLGIYEVCVDTITPVITITPSGIVTVSPGTKVTFTATIVNGGASPYYTWLRNGVPVGVTDQAYTATAGIDFISGTLISVATFGANENPCMDDGYIKSIPTQMEITMGIGAAQSSNTDFKIYPNPNNGDFTIETANAKDYTLNILDLTGRTVHSILLSGSSNTLNLSGKIPSGTYLLSVEQQGSPKQLKHFVVH